MPAKRSTKTSVASAFGSELRGARTAAKLTQQVLAERADVDPVFISFLENGHRQPSLTVLLAIERVLGLGAGELAQRTARRLGGSAADTKRKPSDKRAVKNQARRRRASLESEK